MGLDWITVTGPGVLRGPGREWLISRFGSARTRVSGRKFYACGDKWASGAVLLFEHNSSDSCCIEFDGNTLAAMSADERIDVLRSLMSLGFRVTRLDVALDFVGCGLALGVRAVDSCERGELCGAKVYSTYIERTGAGLKGHTVYLGRRGKNGSGRLTRIYDKGLERRSAPAGEWERWETVFSDDCAIEAAALLVESDDWVATARALSLGAHDFRRVVPGETAISRRPRVEWFARIVEGVAVLRVRKTEKSSPDLERVARWLRTAVAPSLAAMGDKVGVSMADVLLCLVGEVEPSERVRVREVVEHFSLWWRGEFPVGGRSHDVGS